MVSQEIVYLDTAVTLVSLPRPGYTALMGYDEEGRLTSIQHDTNGTVTPAYEYRYGADGGRRWSKDYANNLSTWYPCGVACGAGGLVEKQSDLSGSSWTTSATLLRGNGLISRATGAGAEYHLPDIHGVNSVITDSSGNVKSSNVYDAFGVTQSSQGNASTPYRYGQAAAEGMVNNGHSIVSPNVSMIIPTGPVNVFENTFKCIDSCVAGCGCAGGKVCKSACAVVCAKFQARGCSALYDYCIKKGDTIWGQICMGFYDGASGCLGR